MFNGGKTGKGVTRIVSGPKKNAIVRRVNHKGNKKNPESSSSEVSVSSDKPSNVYDRLYRQKSAKQRKREEDNK